MFWFFKEPGQVDSVLWDLHLYEDCRVEIIRVLMPIMRDINNIKRIPAPLEPIFFPGFFGKEPTAKTAIPTLMLSNIETADSITTIVLLNILGKQDCSQLL